LAQLPRAGRYRLHRAAPATLVEYFYRRANQQCEAHPETGDVQESAYRYPGPKPQTREAAVLMLADAVESASRALVEPTPARIESLVEDIAMKRLLDGQFDECGLTLKQLRRSRQFDQSLTAVYGRSNVPINVRPSPIPDGDLGVGSRQSFSGHDPPLPCPLPP
jgi:hypothetical protein